MTKKKKKKETQPPEQPQERPSLKRESDLSIANNMLHPVEKREAARARLPRWGKGKKGNKQ